MVLLVLGWIMVLLTPAVGIIPGPGGVFVFAAGVALILKNSFWAKRRFAALERRSPRFERYANKALRRPSAKRRAARKGGADGGGCD
jgi:hypothetical protein